MNRMSARSIKPYLPHEITGAYEILPVKGGGYKLFCRDEDGTLRGIPHAHARRVTAALEKSYPPSAYLYVGIRDQRYFKIGISRNVKRRAAELKLQVICTFRFTGHESWKMAFAIERLFHKYFQWLGCHLYGEWFDFGADELNWLEDVMHCFGERHHDTIRYLAEALGDSPEKYLGGK